MTQRVATINNNQSLLVPWEKFKVNYMLTISKIKWLAMRKKIFTGALDKEIHTYTKT